MADEETGVEPVAGEPVKDEPQAVPQTAAQKRIKKAAKKLASAPSDEVAPDGSIQLSSLLAQFEKLNRQNLELENEVKSLRTVAGVQSKEDGGSRVVTGKSPDFELTKPEREAAQVDGAVFRSPFPGFKQVIRRGKTNHLPSGDYTLDPPLVAEFTKGVCVLYDPEDIQLMRDKMEFKKRRGEADFIEVTDIQVKAAALKGTRHIVSPSITVDTPLEDVI